MISATMRFLHIAAYIVKAIFLCISLRKALALRETNAANNSQQSSHIIGIPWTFSQSRHIFKTMAYSYRIKAETTSQVHEIKKTDVLRSLTHWMINIYSPCWWTDMWRWSWGIQIFPNIGGHIAPGISDWTFWGSPLPIEHLPPRRSFIFFCITHQFSLWSLRLWMNTSDYFPRKWVSLMMDPPCWWSALHLNLSDLHILHSLSEFWVDWFAICTLMIKHSKKWIPERLNIFICQR